jgi:hypothetical protein
MLDRMIAVDVASPWSEPSGSGGGDRARPRSILVVLSLVGSSGAVSVARFAAGEPGRRSRVGGGPL